MRRILGFLGGLLVLAACAQPPVYRASAKLIVSTADSLPAAEQTPEKENAFYSTAIEVLRSGEFRRRVQERLHKTEAELQTNLTQLKISRIPGADLIVVTVASPSRDFASDFANALIDEYVKFFNEQRDQQSAQVLEPLARDVQRLGKELNEIKEKIRGFEPDHGDPAAADRPEVKTLSESRNRVQALYNVALVNLYAADQTRHWDSRNVSILERARAELQPISRGFFQRD